jgi:hypothetical protein
VFLKFSARNLLKRELKAYGHADTPNDCIEELLNHALNLAKFKKILGSDEALTTLTVESVEGVAHLVDWYLRSIEPPDHDDQVWLILQKYRMI